MNADFTPNAQCGQCRFFLQFGEEANGLCRFNPPLAFSNGHCDQPKIRNNRPACGQIQLRPEGEKPAAKEKIQPATPAQARRAR